MIDRSLSLSLVPYVCLRSQDTTSSVNFAAAQEGAFIILSAASCQCLSRHAILPSITLYYHTHSSRLSPQSSTHVSDISVTSQAAEHGRINAHRENDHLLTLCRVISNQEWAAAHPGEELARTIRTRRQVKHIDA